MSRLAATTPLPYVAFSNPPETDRRPGGHRCDYTQVDN